MPKTSTFPTLFDDLLQLKISVLAKSGYLTPDTMHRGNFNWSRNGKEVAQISFLSSMYNDFGSIMLSYLNNGKPFKYTIQITSIESNLGTGKIWYFVCPFTHLKCRNLYLFGDYFIHRKGTHSCMYETQTFSKRNRETIKLVDNYLKSTNAYSNTFEPYFKKYYKGKMTKRYRKILQMVENSIDAEQFDSLLVI